MRYQGSVIAEKAAPYGDIVAICDVDREIAEKAREQFGGKATLYEDYRRLLERRDVDVVTIGTPDHWHTAMVIDAVRAGKDVYCEKPLTLTVDEGKRLVKAVQETGRVVQVGSWQRSDHRFRLAVEMVRQGRIGRLERVEVVLGKNVTGGPFQPETPPPHLNWDLWQGQTPDVPYIKERSHYTFRWWYEYSGGQMTDWGAHHLDIAQWGIGALPVAAEGQAKFPSVENGYNVAIDYRAEYRYSNGVVDDGRRHGTQWRHVHRNAREDLREPRHRVGPAGRGPEGRSLAARSIHALCRRQPRSSRADGQAGRHCQPHGELLRLCEDAAYTTFRCRQPTPERDYLPPRQHRHASGKTTAVGSAF